MALPPQVSDSGSPGAGRVQNRHTRSPVEALYAARNPRTPSSPPEMPEIRHFDVPQQAASDAIERDEVGMVGPHEEAVFQYRHSAIDTARRVTGQSSCAGTAVAPDLAAVAGVQSVGLVGGRHIHHAV